MEHIKAYVLGVIILALFGAIIFGLGHLILAYGSLVIIAILLFVVLSVMAYAIGDVVLDSLEWRRGPQ